MTCKREDKVGDGCQMSKGRGLSRWEAGSLFKCYFERDETKVSSKTRFAIEIFLKILG